jgi:hypothetical protein
MAEPQPSQVREGDTIEDEAPVKPASAEDRKAAAALSSLDAIDDSKPVEKSTADQKALDDAMSRLEILSGGKTKAQETAAKEAVAVKKVKVDAKDVALLVRVVQLMTRNRF